jgi:hypothetical protein
MPLGLLLSLRPKTFGAAVITILLLALSCEMLVSSYPDALTVWDSTKRQIANSVGTSGMYIVILTGSSLVVAVVLFLTSLLDKNLGPVISTVFGIAAVSLLALPSKTVFVGEYYRGQSVETAELSPIIHLVLDEHIGIEGIPSEIEGAVELRKELKGFYLDFGFQVFGQAYSQYADTKLSLATMLSGQPDRYVLSRSDIQKIERSVPHNAWFYELSQRGYRTRVYNSLGLNFCGGIGSGVHSCYVYPANSIISLKEAALPVSTLAKAVTASFLDTLVVYRMWTVSAWSVVRKGALLPNWLRQEYKYAAPSSLPVFHQILQDIKREPRGSAFFAHLLVPHHTYMYDENCGIKQDIEDWVNNVSTDANASLGIKNTPESRSRYYGSYFEQLRCTRQMLQKFFEKLQQIGVYDDATIIIHGDHGSRIALGASNRNLGTFSDTDLVDRHSVLFAVRGSGFESGYDTSFRSLQGLFAEMMLRQTLIQGPRDVVIPNPHTSNRGGIEPWIRTPMPIFIKTDSKPLEVRKGDNDK